MNIYEENARNYHEAKDQWVKDLENPGPQPNWFDYLVRPLAEAVQEQMPEATVTCSGPGGLACTCFVTAKTASGKASVAVRPGPLSEAMLFRVDYSREVNSYGASTLGGINGLNYGTVDMPDLEELVELLRARLAELEKGGE